MTKLRLQYVRPTKEKFGHTKVYYNEEYQGYFLKGKISGKWQFETKARIPYITTTTRKALLEELTKALEEA